MINLQETVEWQHQHLEKQAGRELHHLTLNEKTHELRLPEHLAEEDRKYLIERASTLRWVYGRGELSINHPEGQSALDEAFSDKGSHAFEAGFFSEMAIPPGPADCKSSSGDISVFLDFGGSSLKGLVFINQHLACQQAKAWSPFNMSSMDELTATIEGFLEKLLEDHPREEVSHVGISSAGICEDGALLITTLVQGITFTASDSYDPWFLKRLFQKNLPQAHYELINDGVVTALPTRFQPSRIKNLLSLVMGSNLGGGHSGEKGIHELGFIPFISAGGIADEWSGYPGISTCYFSKIGILRLAEEHGYTLGTAREVIGQIHKDQRHGLRAARLIFQTMGQQLAALVVYLKRFYMIDEILLSGGILTTNAVDEMRPAYKEAYQSLSSDSFPSLRMLSIPGVLPEYNQVWNLAMNHFSHKDNG